MAWDKWVAKGTANYNLEILALCLCPESSRTLKIVVRNGAIELVIELYSGEALTEGEVLFANKTIGAVFSEINRALRTGAYGLGATYHPTLGYPTSWWVSHSNLPDDGYTLESIKYEPVDPSEPLKPLYDVALAKEELSSEKVLWEAYGSDNYDLRIRPLCECPEDSKDLKIAVRNGVIESVIDGESGETLTEEHVSDYSYRTIDDLFEHLEHALSSNPPRYLRVTYDHILGHPESLKVIYQYGVDGAAYDGFTLGNIYHKPVEPSLPATTPEASAPPVDLGKRDVSAIDLFSERPGNNVAFSIGPAATVEEVLEKGLRLAGASPVHLAFRGTAAAESVRCGWRGIARTTAQREEAIRYWLGLDEDDDVPDASYLEVLFTATVNAVAPEFQETARSNFMAIVQGGLSTEYMFLTCHVDYAPSEYLLGSGPLSPSVLSVAYDRRGRGTGLPTVPQRARRRRIRDRSANERRRIPGTSG